MHYHYDRLTRIINIRWYSDKKKLCSVSGLNNCLYERNERNFANNHVTSNTMTPLCAGDIHFISCITVCNSMAMQTSLDDNIDIKKHRHVLTR